MQTTATSDRIEVRNPATREVLGHVATTPADGVDGVVGAVARVQPLWAQLRTTDRARYLRRAAQAVIDEFAELEQLLARSTGRPVAEVAARELLPAIDALRWLAGEAGPLVGGRRLAVPRALHPLMRARLEHEAVGVVAVIGAGSAPLAQPLCQIAAALVGGNGVVYKPGPRAALSGERIARLLARAGLPEGLVRVVHGGPELGRALAGASGVRRVLFTGGRKGGAEVARLCAETGTGVVLELGGADAALVLEDANLQRAAAGVLWAACAGAGQSHGSIKRVIVARDVHDRFVAELVDGARRVRLGDPVHEDTDLGPLADESRREELSSAVAGAVAEGAQLHCGAPEQPLGLPGAFHSPVVLSGVTGTMRPLRERIHGPLLAVATVSDSVEGVRLVNEGEHGLGASVWTSDRYRGARIAHELQAGAVWLNDHLPAPGLAGAPWGSPSGGSIWRHQGAAGVLACVEPKVVSWEPAGSRSPWWFPYDRSTARAAGAIAELGSIRDADRERALRAGTLALMRVALRAVRGR